MGWCNSFREEKKNLKISRFITNVHFVKGTIDLSKEKQKRKTFENKKRRKRK